MKFLAYIAGAVVVGELLARLGKWVLENTPEPYGQYAIILFCATLVGTTLGLLWAINKREKKKKEE